VAQKSNTSLAEELSLYDSKKPEWLESHDGQYVVIGHKTVAGFFPTFEKAFEAGLAKFGIGTDFLVKQVVEQEPVFVIY